MYVNLSLLEGMMKQFLLPVLGGSLLLLSACGTEDAGPATISTTAPMEAKYSTTDGIIPFPNNILFSGTTDATLNITSGGVEVTDITDPKGAMNTLDGFSTVAPITTTFALPIDAATITATSVRVFPVTSADPYAASVQPPAAYATTGLAGAGAGAGAGLVFGVDFKALPSPSNPNVLVIKPVKPLQSNTNYMVIVTNALKSTSGEAARPSALFTLLKHTSPLVDPTTGASQVPGRDDATAAQLEGLRQLTQAMLAIGNAVGIPPADVAVAWSFKTQTLGKVLAKIQADSAADPNSFITSGSAQLGAFPFVPFAQGLAAGGNTALLDAYTASPASFDTIGSVVVGAVKLPYYLDAAANANDPAPLTSTFQVDSYGSPTLKSVQTVPFLMTIPNTAPAASTGGKWPVVIFQHGFTVDKSTVFGIANTLAKAGFATIAIDAVLHGDRTFGIDFANNTTGDAGADGIADTSGKHYLNLTSLLTSRDNIRQSVADLIHLTRLLELQNLVLTGMDVVNNTTGLPAAGGDGTLDLIVGGGFPVSYVGHSNGGILGTVLAGVEPAIQTLVLA
ncbi:MAG TPA: hypothetical protein EYG66_07920, partial [Mariprofundaceae bacterium]|nr:hypothetical protein [Mariprofundaceae bacterium]